MSSKLSLLIFLILGALILASCSDNPPEPSPIPLQVTTTAQETPSSVTLEPEVQLTSTPSPITVTSAPLVAQVNGEGILLESYEIELNLFRLALGTSLATYDEDIVLQDMIDQVLLAQGASAAGFTVDEIMYQNRILELGLSEQDFTEWKAAHGYSEELFRQAMERSIAAAWMRDQIIAQAPETTEQVHARQILFYSLEEAQAVYDQLEAGMDFGTLSAEYEPVTKGDLGWFPRGFLTVPELDEILFSLEPGEYSAIIQTKLGYHIVQVLERNLEYPLTAEGHRVVQLQTLAQWLDTRRNESEILLFLP